MPTYFNIHYEFSPAEIMRRIYGRVNSDTPDYVCGADGNILQMVHRDEKYREVINGGMFSICDSSWVPIYLKMIYGIKVSQYCGSQIFNDLISAGKYRMYFLGADRAILDSLKSNLLRRYGNDIASAQFVELPFCDIEDFDYKGIADAINKDNPDIVWLSLGAPKQEMFMSRLKPYLNRGVMIAVGAVFKFYSGISEKRAPAWMVKTHLEFVYRLFQEPGKQLHRCARIITTLPPIIIAEIQMRNRKI